MIDADVFREGELSVADCRRFLRDAGRETQDKVGHLARLLVVEA